MGVIDVSDNQGRNQTEEVAGKKESKWKAFSWDQLDKVDSPTKKLDKDANFYEKVPVPPKAIIGFKMRINDFNKDITRNDEGEFNIKLDCEMVECVSYPDRTEEYEGFRFDHWLSTNVPRGKRISSLGHLIAKYSKGSFDEISDKDLVKGLASLLSKEPTFYGLWNWKGGYKNEKGEWVEKFWDYDEFPTGVDGEKVRQVQVGNYRVNAQGKMTELYGKKENIPNLANKGKGKGQGKTQASTQTVQTQAQVKDPEPKSVKVEDMGKGKEDKGGFDDLEL